MGNPTGMMGNLQRVCRRPQPLTWTSNGADDGIRTHDPHLGNVRRTLRRVRPSPLDVVPSADSSAPARPLRPFRLPGLPSHCDTTACAEPGFVRRESQWSALCQRRGCRRISFLGEIGTRIWVGVPSSPPVRGEFALRARGWADVRASQRRATSCCCRLDVSRPDPCSRRCRLRTSAAHQRMGMSTMA